MRVRLGCALVAAIVIGAVGTLMGQPAAPAAKKNPLLKLAEEWPADEVLQARRSEADARQLFRDVEPLAFTLTADFKAINKDRNPESTKRYPGVISAAAGGASGELPVQLGTRGHFRLMSRNCDFVPLRVEFPRDRTAGTAFDGQTNLKLGTHCRGDRAYDNYTLREYLTYRLFNMVTPLSFRARLGRATYVDATSKKAIGTRYSIFIEHENEVARRFGGRIVELPRIVFNDLDGPTLTRMMLFEYMIGNTDFSIWALHNVRLVQDPRAAPLPGAVRLRSVRIRPRALRVARPAHRHPQRPRSSLPRPVPDGRRVRGGGERAEGETWRHAGADRLDGRPRPRRPRGGEGIPGQLLPVD